MRHTRAVKTVMQAARSPIRVGDLAAKLTADFPGTPESVIEGMLAQLVAQRILITSLHPPMTATDPLACVIKELIAVGGDFHWANISAPTLHIFDWEGWGLAPTGYDAAVLYSHSLLVPPVATRIRDELAHLLDTTTGRFAELVTITQLLHSTTRGDNLPLAEPLRNRAALLLGRPVPLPTAR